MTYNPYFLRLEEKQKSVREIDGSKCRNKIYSGRNPKEMIIVSSCWKVLEIERSRNRKSTVWIIIIFLRKSFSLR